MIKHLSAARVFKEPCDQCLNTSFSHLLEGKSHNRQSIFVMDLKQELELSDTKSLVSKRPRWKSKLVIGGAVTAVLLLGAMVSMAVYFSLTAKQKSARLVEVDLNEGETLTYQVDQHIQLQGSDVQKGKSFSFILGLYLPYSKVNEVYSVKVFWCSSS